ncbi:hypothetical protein BJY52DRAFT_1303169 [Lactarius psammicola]|nr:hypothetical protein BJY52DRAFT_1303169 [Lactarius psammicola]
MPDSVVLSTTMIIGLSPALYGASLAEARRKRTERVVPDGYFPSVLGKRPGRLTRDYGIGGYIAVGCAKPSKRELNSRHFQRGRE